MKRSLVAHLGLLALGLCLLPLAPLAAAGDSELQFEGGVLRAYHINHARLLSESGIEGLVEIQGRRWNGSAVPLFRGQSEVRTKSLELAFYLDDDLRSLEISASSPGGPQTLEVELANLTEPEASLRGLDPPTRGSLAAVAPSHLAFQSSSLEGAGSVAAAAFGRKAPRSARPFLLASALAALVAAALPRRAGRRRLLALALPLAAALATTLVLAWTAGLRPTLFAALFPDTRNATPLSGVLDRRVETRPDYQLVIYAPGQSEGGTASASGSQEPGIVLIGIAAPPERGIPLAELVALAAKGPPGGNGAAGRPSAASSAGPGLRFAEPPLITLRGGTFRVGADKLLLGWMVHGNE